LRLAPDRGTAARIYWEATRAGRSPSGTANNPITVPTSVTIVPGSYSRRSLEHFSEPARGGHFAFLERSERLVAGVRTTFRHLSARDIVRASSWWLRGRCHEKLGTRRAPSARREPFRRRQARW
jgi:hypothetical protein